MILEAYLKHNLDFASEDNVKDSFIEYVPIIDNSLITVISKKIEKEEKSKDKDEYEQLSLFSYIDED